MQVKRLKLKNFRGIAKMDLQFHRSVNVLIGANGAGKSAILESLAIMLSRLVGRIRSTSGTGRFFRDADVTNGQRETQNSITVAINEQDVSWTVTKAKSGLKRQTITNQEQLKEIASKIHADYESDKDLDFPLAVYYPVNRAVLDVPLRVRRRHPFDQLSAYDQALSGARNDFRLFFEWYRNREDLENEKRIRRRTYRDRELKAVRKAIESLFPGSSDLHVQRRPLRMVVNKNGTTLEVDQLSDGEKCQLALSGDLARRLAIANPSLENPLRGEGVVVIDEIDLHLHPSWQRSIISLLTKTFPKCQFIVSTHSPLVVSEVERGSIVVLKHCGDSVRWHRPECAYGIDSNRVLEDLMGVPERPKAVKDSITMLFFAIDEGDLDAARETLDELNHLVGSDPQLTRARTLLRRKEIIGK